MVTTCERYQGGKLIGTLLAQMNPAMTLESTPSVQNLVSVGSNLLAYTGQQSSSTGKRMFNTCSTDKHAATQHWPTASFSRPELW